MKPLSLTFRFDDTNKTLTRFNGLSIETLAKFLKTLNRSVGADEESKLVLSEIKGNCYAPVISMMSKMHYESIKTLHTEIAEGRTNGLNADQRKYYGFLRGLTKTGLNLNIYDREKEFYKTVEELREIDTFPYFFQTNAYRGILTRIGSRNMKSRNTIFISTYPYEIEIDEVQDGALRTHYKQHLLEFYITEKKDKKNGRVESASLDDFRLISKTETAPFIETVNFIREKHGDYFSENMIPSKDG